MVAGAAGAFLYGVESALCVPVGASGVALMLAVELHGWWRRGALGPGRMEAVCGCCALLCGVPVYYMPDSVPVLAAGIGGFFGFILLMFAAQVWSKARRAGVLVGRWKRGRKGAHRANADGAADAASTGAAAADWIP